MSTTQRRRAVLALGLMATTAAVAHWARPTIHLAERGPKVELDSWFPTSFGDWRVDDSLPVVLPAPDVQALLKSIYNQILSRTYVNRSGERIMLSVAYGGDQSDATRAHRPEVCYPAQGFQISENAVGEIPLGSARLRVRQLMSHQGPRHEPITYWIVVGEKVAVSGTEQKLAQLSYGFRGQIPSGMLVRVSSIDPDAQHGYSIQARFLNDLVAAVPSAARSYIFGSPAA